MNPIKRGRINTYNYIYIYTYRACSTMTIPWYDYAIWIYMAYTMSAHFD